MILTVPPLPIRIASITTGPTMPQLKNLIMHHYVLQAPARIRRDIVPAQIPCSAPISNNIAPVPLSPPLHPLRNIRQSSPISIQLATIRDRPIHVPMGLQNSALLRTVSLARIRVQRRRRHGEGSELIAVVRAGQRVDEAAAVALAGGVHAAGIDAVFSLQVREQFRCEFQVVDARDGV